MNSLSDFLALLAPADLIAPWAPAGWATVKRIIAAVRATGPVGHVAFTLLAGVVASQHITVNPVPQGNKFRRLTRQKKPMNKGLF